MKMQRLAARYPGYSAGWHPVLVLTLCFLLAGLSTVPSAVACETGIRGTAMWGPVSPGPAKHGKSDEAPMQASFTVYSAEAEVARFKSAANGQFEVSLPAGDYTIVPDEGTPIPFPQRQKTTVSVPSDGFATITIRLDSGMK